MKKLLILGANPETVSLINIAKSKGIYTIVTDYDPNAFAKPYADKSYDVDGLDVDGLVALCKTEKVDGVIVGTADPLIKPYQKLCERLNFPCFANSLSAEILTNKFLFKEKCKEFGILGIPDYKIPKDFTDADLKDVVFPVFVKPADSNSGKGMTICDRKEDLKAAIDKAIFNSPTGMYLVERYMTCPDMFLYYTFKDGKCFLSATADKFVSREQVGVSTVCLGCTYPSVHTELYVNTLHDRFCELFKHLGLENGVLMITAFVENNNLYVYDPGFRLQGEAPDLFLKHLNNYNHREMLVDFALNGNMTVKNDDLLSNYNFNDKFAASIWFLLKEGVVSRIEGMTEIEQLPQIVEKVQRFEVGDLVKPDFVGTEKQVFVRFYSICDNKLEFMKLNDYIQNKLKVYDKNGNNMLLNGLNNKELR
jgi:biotin carboxylase